LVSNRNDVTVTFCGNVAHLCCGGKVRLLQWSSRTTLEEFDLHHGKPGFFPHVVSCDEIAFWKVLLLREIQGKSAPAEWSLVRRQFKKVLYENYRKIKNKTELENF
jgi:hypothetical protein